MFIAWALWHYKSMTAIRGEMRELLASIEKRGDYGCQQTKKLMDEANTTNSVLKEISFGIREMSHYLQVSIENATGRKPKPPLPRNGK